MERDQEVLKILSFTFEICYFSRPYMASDVQVISECSNLHVN